MANLPPPPEMPDPSMCCDSGCGEYCVYEIYRQEKQAYDELVKQHQHNPDGSHQSSQ